VSSLTPLRANLIQEVTFIFPIEPLSAPDLLFTILGVPLPVPVAASDPAPPPLLPDFPDVNEDNTATALGYVAQVLQHISAYLGSMLVYPVTCCGSRSVIKDPISAMMGPRTWVFPIYIYRLFLTQAVSVSLCIAKVLRHIDMNMAYSY